MEISSNFVSRLAVTLVVTHQRVMPIIIADNHFDGNTSGESRELRATKHARNAVGWTLRYIVSQGKKGLQNCNVLDTGVFLMHARYGKEEYFLSVI